MYTSEYVLDMLWARIASRTQKAVAAEMGVSASHLNDVMHGRRALTGAVLDWLGLERVVGYAHKGRNPQERERGKR